MIKVLVDVQSGCMTVKDLRAAPGRDGAVLRAEAASLRECAERLDALAAGLPAQRMPDWADNVLMTLAERCRVAAADLETAAAISDAGLDDERDDYSDELEFGEFNPSEAAGNGRGRHLFSLPLKAPGLAGLASLPSLPVPPIASKITRRTS